MAKALALLALLTLLFAGCASSPQDEAEVATPAPTIKTVVGQAPASPRLTDTLHFLASPP
jgi:PBP1b-binding outer membrane lipoprotein LpoB